MGQDSAHNFRSQSVRTYEEGLELEKKIPFPVRLKASFVLGGWAKLANSKKEFRELLKKGLELSPVSEVLVEWED